MEKYLIILTVCTRREPKVNMVTEALELARNLKARLWSMDAKGSRRMRWSWLRGILHGLCDRNGGGYDAGGGPVLRSELGSL